MERKQGNKIEKRFNNKYNDIAYSEQKASLKFTTWTRCGCYKYNNQKQMNRRGSN